MVKTILSIGILATFFLYSCNEVAKNESSEITNTETISETKKGVFGTYEGNFPGANSLIKETLTLNSDSTFIKTLVYVDKGDETFSDKGTFKVDSGKVILNIDHKKEGGYYKIFNDYLLLLNTNGEEIITDKAEMYKLEKLENKH